MNWLQRILLLWAPIYLMLTQKRVYSQRWGMTLLKFRVIGWRHVWLLLVALMIDAARGMAC